MSLLLKYGEVYLVNFDPSVGHEYQKMRPAVIIQSEQQLKRSGLITVMPLTSQIGKRWPEDIVVKKDNRNCLFVDSIIKVHCITSFDKARFVKRVGTMDTQTLEQVKKYLRMHFNI